MRTGQMSSQSQKISGFTILVGTSGPHKYSKTNTHTHTFTRDIFGINDTPHESLLHSLSSFTLSLIFHSLPHSLPQPFPQSLPLFTSSQSLPLSLSTISTILLFITLISSLYRNHFLAHYRTITPSLYCFHFLVLYPDHFLTLFTALAHIHFLSFPSNVSICPHFHLSSQSICILHYLGIQFFLIVLKKSAVIFPNKLQALQPYIKYHQITI